MRSSIHHRAVLLATLALLATASGALADGSFFSAPEWILYENEQTAFLSWNEANDTETLVILPGFHGSALDFAWVVPVPSVPEVDTASRELFVDLAIMSHPIRRNRDDGWSCDRGAVYSNDTGGANVEILQHDIIGIYEVYVLQAAEASALADTLDAWGFLPEDDTEFQTILADYVEREWTFVAMKVDSTAFADANPGQDFYYYRSMEPIEFVFDCEAPVYPMLLSRLSAYWQTAVTVFTEAQHRLDFPGAETEYANRLSTGEYEAVQRDYPFVASRTAPGRFLTRLTRQMAPRDMDVDLILTRADNDDEYRGIEYSGLPLASLLPASWLIGWGVWKVRRRIRARARRVSATSR